MCRGGRGYFAVQSVRVRHILQLGGPNEDGQVDTRFLSPCRGRGGAKRQAIMQISVFRLRGEATVSGNISSAVR